MRGCALLDVYGSSMILLASLPLLFLACVFLIRHRTERDPRWTLVESAIVLGVAVVVITEVLSAMGAFRQGPIALSWSITIAVTLPIAWFHRPCVVPPPGAQRGAERRLFASTIVPIVVLTGAIAFASPPNTWDSMTYHLPRVLHWLQNGDVWPFPTAEMRQLYLSPFAEYAIAHLVALTGGVELANIPQWGSYLGTIACVSLIAKLLGAGRLGQLASGAVAASTPIVIMESTSTQNDLVAALWMTVVVAVSVAIRHDRQMEPDGSRWWVAVTGGLAGGLAMLTKGTSFVLLAPFVVWGAVAGIRRWGRRLILPMLASVVIATVLAGPHFLRTTSVFGSPLGPTAEHRYANESFGIAPLVSNSIRNVAVQFALPNERANELFLERPVRSLHAILGLDPDDSATSWTPYRVSANVNDEDHAPNPLQTILAVGAITIAISRRGGPRNAYVLSLAASFLLFSAALKWQPWQTRLMLPWFVLSAPLVGVVIERFGRRSTVALIVITLVAGLPWVLFNRTRPLVPVGGIVTDAPSVLTGDHAEIMFAKQPELREPYRETVKAISELDCEVVGIDLGGDAWEFPLWWMADATSDLEPAFVHVNPHRQTRDTRPGHPPCAVVVRSERTSDLRHYAGREYQVLRHHPPLAIYVPAR